MDCYAEAESKDIQFFHYCYDYVVVIPVCNEASDFLENVFSLITDECLIVLVVNSPIGNEKWQTSNQFLIDNLRNKSKSTTQVTNTIEHLRFESFHDVLLVDRNSSGFQINPKQGVGLARKIGCDIALKLYVLGSIKSPWVFSTDADVILPCDYFSQIQFDEKKFSAIVLDFKHITDDKYLQNIQFSYDFKMRYYLAGIQFAQVGYDYIPLGSTLIASMECYAKVRGFPKKNAAEDFYLLNKLAKVLPIKHFEKSCTIQIQARLSNRVPFGTGPALQKIADLNSTQHYLYYHPKCFIYLKKWKLFLDSLWQKSGLVIQSPKEVVLKQLYDFFNCSQVFEKSKNQITNKIRWQQFIHQWFDAFRILKAVHFVDKKFQRLNYKELLKDDTFGKVTNSNLNQFIKENDTF